MLTTPQPLPDTISDQIIEAECCRLKLHRSEMPAIEFAAYFPAYATDSPAYAGPLVVVVWSSDPGDHSSYILQGSKWTHARSS